ncbi:hypothetical protein JF66_15275 [Cryobacterium sp. MLB-32]|uniref:hypothetical protein n=1 Tax=Cryobacterium sp. MLB-32 TaxID=1529318 RepID=UPI0004E63622|nr:hypothetical protein [Cryobacterium sp. MLB-32]KFF58869.1 hypothetical protein JF66_15275 [Cryobacterium sp. MLB-32]
MSRLTAGLRSLPLALVGSASARLHDLTTADAAVRAPLTLNRRIGVVQAAGGSGASTVGGEPREHSGAPSFRPRARGQCLGRHP